MNISYTQYYLLQFSTHDATIHTNVLQNTPTCDTMKTPIRGRKRHHADYGRRKVLIRRGHRQDTWQNGRICTALVSQWRTARRQSWRCLVYAPARLAGLLERAASSFQSHARAQAQPKQKIASQKAQNVRSLSSNSLPDILDNRPRNNAATYCSRLYPFVCIVATSSALCQVIHTVGGSVLCYA